MHVCILHDLPLHRCNAHAHSNVLFLSLSFLSCHPKRTIIITIPLFSLFSRYHVCEYERVLVWSYRHRMSPLHPFCLQFFVAFVLYSICLFVILYLNARKARCAGADTGAAATATVAAAAHWVRTTKDEDPTWIVKSYYIIAEDSQAARLPTCWRRRRRRRRWWKRRQAHTHRQSHSQCTNRMYMHECVVYVCECFFHGVWVWVDCFLPSLLLWMLCWLVAQIKYNGAKRAWSWIEWIYYYILDTLSVS